jgi:misacylated tRNA(Ala) deacylase
VAAGVSKFNNVSGDLKKQEKKLLMEIAKYEATRVQNDLQNGKNALVYRGDGGMEFISMVLSELKEVLTREKGVVILASGHEKQVGQISIAGEPGAVAELVKKVIETFPGIKGGGKGRWQGKLGEWKKGDLAKLQALIEETIRTSKST